jgi:glycosyltransferase involved in cell wall biosynthesis
MSSLEPGGTERQMVELLRRLSPQQWEIHLACVHARGAWFARAAEAAVTVTAFPIYGFHRPDTCRQAWALSRWCTKHRIAVVHTSDLYTNIFALPAAALARVPVRVGNRRGLYDDIAPAYTRVQRAAFSCAHAIVANSSATAEQLRREHIPERKIALIPNGLDIDLFAPPTPRQTRRRVIMVAKLRPEKGHDILIDAAAIVLQQYPDARFALAGDGPQQSAVEARLAERGIGAAFTFLGERDDVPALLADTDIVVLPSRTESLPNAVLEGMAAGLPVIASTVGGIPDVIDDGRTGLLFPVCDVQALAARICEVMADPTLGTRLGEAARAKVRARYSFDRMVSATETLYYRELLKRGRARMETAA